MKTKFISHDISKFYDYVNSNHIEEPYLVGQMDNPDLLELYYLKHYKKHGWKLDIETKTLYMIFDEPLFFNVHDEVDLGEEGIRIITDKTIYLIHQYIEYVLV